MTQASRAQIDSLIYEAEHDELGLWNIVGLVQDEFGVSDPAMVMADTLKIVEDLLESGEVKAGHHKQDGSGQFEKWNLSVGDTVRRIQVEWEALGRTPDIFDIVIFVDPERA